MIEYEILGEPVAQGRPRASTVNGYVQMIDPTKSRNYKEYVRLVASQYALSEPLEGPLKIRVNVYRPLLKNFSKKKAAAAEAGLLRPTTKPDIDNLVKGVKDACNKVLWRDDSQVVELKASKFYSSRPRVEIRVEMLIT
ncbi:RusA family crossover junction endodeoxyribonuclease [Jeotgalibacillus sp. ET6]|uniref:RusA family crossover junction endodeoxyribonuclease n=1 Tax=Jeotgalibacillus sp. ET6 TaxID=3037260 RepID=UPI002418698A|nr:RusA family crossover junction endodeoxyribonuclease [Jeotgalibacillus sp. ET6]MDG5470533.1 RusA family crossover junction endodeoxyribonuclease [Jeotgalibacillus sp. ET6]